MAVALVCCAYVLRSERLGLPYEKSYTVEAEFSDASAVTPGLGQAVNVAGVRVGQITGRELRGGRAVVRLRIDPGKLPRLHAGTRATLVPNTPLKDMQVDLAPGPATAPVLRRGSTIPLRDTSVLVESDQLLRALDTDTREYLRVLIDGLGAGVRGRGGDLRRLLRSSAPTTAQLRRVTALLASRRAKLPRLVHNLSTLSRAAGSADAEIARVVTAGNATLAAVAQQDGSLRQALAELPSTTAVARRTLVRAAPFTRSLRRTLLAYEPAVPQLKAALRSAPDAVRGLLPLPVKPLGRFTRAVAPQADTVRAAARDLGAAVGPLTTAFKAIDQTTNQLTYTKQGIPPYLFWLAWFAHNGNSMLSTADAHGGVWRGLAIFSCASAQQSGAAGELTQALGGKAACP
jgi:phospholipid/cholesterol/gamma-HCH transport system substrate-binding protein